jgi:putative transposase
MVMSRAVMSKDEYLKGRGVNVVWPASGIPERIHVDNGKEFRSQALARGLAQYGIEVDFRPPAQPHWGGHIERLIGTMMGAVHLLPGSTSRNSVERGDYDSEASAVMTMSELETWLVHQIAGVYHHTVHRGLGKAPITAWTEGIAARSSPVRHPRDEDRFFLDFLPAEKRLVQRSGITLFGITYSDGVLSTFLSRPQRIVLVRYDPRDLSRVYVRDPDGIYWPIPYSDRRLPSVTLSELKSAHKRLRESGHKHATQAQLFASMDDQRALVADAVVKTKAARREHERRRRALGEAKAERKVPVVSLDTPEDGEEAGPILPYSVEEWS